MSTQPAPNKTRILVVEDAIEEIFLLRALLEKQGGYQVTTSQDGEHAARLVAEQSFDLVLTDLNLPGMDGYDLIRTIKSLRPRLPVLASTGYTAEYYLEHAYRAGADHVLTKPIDKDDLLSRVAELLGTRALAAPRGPSVLAVGALPGDIEWGAAGFLLGCRQRGFDALLLPLSSRAGTMADAERRGAERLGARVIIHDPEGSGSGQDPTATQLLLERIVREIKPALALVPSLADGNADRREAHRITRTAMAAVPTVLAYETATSTPEFHPTRFEDISSFLDRKLDALSGYLARGRADLDPAFTEAAARYWGKHVGFGLAEAFEVLRDDGGPVG